jgi:hypothetical protein
VLLDFQSFFMAKEYDKAKEVLTKNKDQFDHGVYYHNMAMISYQKGDLAQTRLFLEKAKREGFDGLEINKKITEVKKELGITYLEEVENMHDFIYSQYHAYPQAIWYSSGIALCLIIVLIFKKKMHLYGVLLSAFLITISILYKIYLSTTYLVLWNQEVTLYQGPSSVFETTFTVPQGSLMILREHKEGWKKVVFPSNAEGWVKDTNYTIINE